MVELYWKAYVQNGKIEYFEKEVFCEVRYPDAKSAAKCECRGRKKAGLASETFELIMYNRNA